jgi:hypothetical protein
MKKFCVILTLCLLCATVNAQSYYPMLDSVSNVWHHVGNVIPVRTNATATNCFYPSQFSFFGYTAETSGDTSMNGLTYYKLEEHPYIGGAGSECLFGFMREDTAAQQVYFMDNQFSPEVLLYDFSLQVGDSIYYDFLQSSGYYYDGYFKVDSISVMTITGGPRRVFYLRNYAAPLPAYPLMWIEGVGHPGHVVFTYSENASWGFGWFTSCNDGIPRDFFQTLTCFEQSNQNIYFDTCAYQQAQLWGCFFFEDSCTYYNLFCGSVQEISAIYQLNISPNPVKDEFRLSVEAARPAGTELKITDLSGKVVKKQPLMLHPGTNEHTINCSELRAGIYFLEAENARSKLVKVE